MPRFHLNVFDDIIASDDEGIERIDLEEARNEAIMGARALIAEKIMAGEPVYQSHRVEITDENGAVLHIVRFSDMLSLRP